MILWRISRFADLSGKGGLKYSARWHSAGSPVLYTADSSAGALLEICAHTSRTNSPRTFTLLKIVGNAVPAEEVFLSQLQDNWIDEEGETRPVGSEWLASGRTALLRVPSALVPESWNYLLNPLHPEAKAFQIERIYNYPFDLRLKG
jgi:RES domain-containing protein